MWGKHAQQQTNLGQNLHFFKNLSEKLQVCALANFTLSERGDVKRLGTNLFSFLSLSHSNVYAEEKLSHQQLLA